MARMFALLPLANQELHVGKVVVGVAPKVVDLLRRDDETAVVTAELADDAAVNAVLVARQAGEVLNDERGIPPSAMSSRIARMTGRLAISRRS